MSISPSSIPARAGTLTLLFTVSLLSSDVTAQEPQIPQVPDYLEVPPSWRASAVEDTMYLAPLSTHLGIGVDGPRAALHVRGSSVLDQPATGSVIVGSPDQNHLQVDANDIRVAGPSQNTVGTLHLQRYGGPIVVHSSNDLSYRVYFPLEGGLSLGTPSQRQFGVAMGLVGNNWPMPASTLAVDGDIYAARLIGRDARFLSRLRVGTRTHEVPGGAWDDKHPDAIAMIGGKLTAQEIVVHIDDWADFVFDPSYRVKPLAEVAAYIAEHKHLPDVPSEKEVLEEGIDLAEMNRVLLQKVEELTLHAIQQEARIVELEAKCK